MIRRNTVEATEYEEQCALADWCATMEGRVPALAMFSANPNGGVRPAKFRIGKDGKPVRFSPEGQRLKRMGVKAGFPDILLLHPSRDIHGLAVHGLAIELKIDDGEASKEQREWIKRLRMRRYRAEIVVGWVRAARLIVEYLSPVLTETERNCLHSAIPMH